MKKVFKLFCVLMVSIMLVMPFNYVDAKTTKKTTTTKATTTTGLTFENSQDEKAINIYVFYSSTCPHCQELHEYLAELKQDKDIKDKFNVVDYEVSGQGNPNASLLQEVKSYFNVSDSYVPFYVIGNEDYTGFGESSKETLKKAIEDAYSSSSYKDIVAAIVDGNTDLLNSEDEGNSIVGMIVLGVCVVIIIALVVCSSRNKYYDDEEDEEDTTAASTKTEDNETSKEESEEANKTNDSKKDTKTTKNKKSKK